MIPYALAVAFAAVLGTFVVAALHRSRERHAWHRTSQRRSLLRGWRRR
jgi:hypothetical protein